MRSCATFDVSACDPPAPLKLRANTHRPINLVWKNQHYAGRNRSPDDWQLNSNPFQ